MHAHDARTAGASLSRRARPLVQRRRRRGHRGREAISRCVLRSVLPVVRRGHGRAMPDAAAEGPPPEDPPILDDASVAPDAPVEPGLVWLTQADARGLATAEEHLSYVVNLKLSDPTGAPAFVDEHLSSTSLRDPGLVAGHPRSARQGGAGARRQPCGSAAGCSGCSPSRASRCSSEAGWPTRPDASDCSRRSAEHRGWSQSCCSPST